MTLRTVGREITPSSRVGDPLGETELIWKLPPPLARVILETLKRNRMPIGSLRSKIQQRRERFPEVVEF